MTQQDMILYGVAALAFLTIGGLGLAFTGGSSNGAARKRAKSIGAGDVTSGRPRKGNDDNSARRKETQKMLAKLREQDQQRKKSLVPQDIKGKIDQAGLSITPATFWIISGVVGAVFAALAFISGAEGVVAWGMELKSRPVVIAMAGLTGLFGLPRWTLSHMASSRAKKMTNQFADAIDIIVRGVKSGLPLAECLQIISRESPAPLGPEFQTLTDSIAMGTNLERALQNLYSRVPLPEINFFVIVLSIQSKAGGNLSEALGNLSAVIRSRRMMREKIKALSSEAKASGMIIGALPFAVGTMVFITTPDYIMELFRTETGHFLLVLSAIMMTMGILIMRKMINFDM
jgi:tight adherence protein B